MSSARLPNNVCSPLRTPSGSPPMDVTMPNRSSCTWARNAPDSAPASVAWLPAATADQRLTPIAQRSCVGRIQNLPELADKDDATVAAMAQPKSLGATAYAALATWQLPRLSKLLVYSDICRLIGLPFRIAMTADA